MAAIKSSTVVSVTDSSIHSNNAYGVRARLLNFPGTFFLRPRRKKLPGTHQAGDRISLIASNLDGISRRYAPFPELSSYAPDGRNFQELIKLVIESR